MKSNSVKTRNYWLTYGTRLLTAAGILSSRLDTLILLEHVCHCDRARLLAHLEEPLSSQQMAHFIKLLRARTQRKPIAYLINRQSFYGLDLYVDESVLVPRAESESIIALAEVARSGSPNFTSIIDVGTGSGALAIALKKKWPHTRVVGVDNSKRALGVARMNARTHKADVEFAHSSLLEKAPGHFDIIVANLPYVSHQQATDPETDHEPAEALYADDDGLSLYKQLFASLHAAALQKAHLIIEAEPRQHQRLVEAALQHNIAFLKTEGFGQLYQVKTA